MYIYYIFFIHSSIEGHSGSFHTLATVDSTAINMGVHVSLQNSTPFPSKVNNKTNVKNLVLPDSVMLMMYIVTECSTFCNVLHS